MIIIGEVDAASNYGPLDHQQAPGGPQPLHACRRARKSCIPRQIGRAPKLRRRHAPQHRQVRGRPAAREAASGGTGVGLRTAWLAPKSPVRRPSTSCAAAQPTSCRPRPRRPPCRPRARLARKPRRAPPAPTAAARLRGARAALRARQPVLRRLLDRRLPGALRARRLPLAPARRL